MAILAKIAIFEARFLKNEVPDQKSATQTFFQPIKIQIPNSCFLPVSTHLKALGTFPPPNPGFGHLAPKWPNMAKMAKIAIFEARYLKNEVPDQKSATQTFFQPIKIQIPNSCFLPVSTHLKALGTFPRPKSRILPFLPQNCPFLPQNCPVTTPPMFLHSELKLL